MHYLIDMEQTWRYRLKRAGKVFFLARSPEAPRTMIERQPVSGTVPYSLTKESFLKVDLFSTCHWPDPIFYKTLISTYTQKRVKSHSQRGTTTTTLKLNCTSEQNYELKFYYKKLNTYYMIKIMNQKKKMSQPRFHHRDRISSIKKK